MRRLLKCWTGTGVRVRPQDSVLLDSAARLHVDDQLMGEMKGVAAPSNQGRDRRDR
jgi:signal recognition particle GTPase